MIYQTSDIARIIQADAVIINDGIIEHLLPDSRKVVAPAHSLFFALKGSRRDGRQFIPDLYSKGVRNFVISEKVETSLYPEANFLLVKDTLAALQQLAVFHRKQFSIPVIGITGSNGKTIVKEWLFQLLQQDYTIVRSPKSYNSQTGVPLSVWQMKEQHTLAIFEAGISQPGEMEKLEAIIKPTIGVMTNIGEAHNEGFSSQVQKAEEKTELFATCPAIIYSKDNLPSDFNLERFHIQKWQRDDIAFYHCSKKQPAWLQVINVAKEKSDTTIEAICEEKKISINIPFTDDAAVENAISCWAVMLVLGIAQPVIESRMKQLLPVNMRLEFKKGINHCAVINDSYSADLDSLSIALNFLDQQSAGTRKTVIVSDFLETGITDEKLYRQIVALLKEHAVNRIIGIGEKISSQLQSMQLSLAKELITEVYNSTEEFLLHFRSTNFKEETILLKGARIFEFERIAQLLEQKVHQTVLEINLNALVHNLKQYQQSLKPTTKLMAMVKAFAYGSGGAEIAGILQFHKIDYLGVAYADEGVELRKAGISLPIMVMNPEENSFEAITDHNLEPDLYSFDMLRAFDLFLKKEGIAQYPVHIELETGMNRLGFDIKQLHELIVYLNKTSSFKIQTIFSHLAASEDPAQDVFTLDQYEKFMTAATDIEKAIGYSVVKHIANTAAITRIPSLQADMVRLGIGMYGVDSAGSKQLNLQPVATLKSTVAQLKQVAIGESVGYNRKGVVNRPSMIATIRVGYADGYPRKLGNGNGKMMIRGKLAPVVGSVCMDMTMVDVTDIPGVKEGDEVLVFGKELPVEQIAAWAQTIPYEIMTGISQRVKRIYFEE